jgi:hypothetical protein
MTTFTSTLPDDLLEMLNLKAKELHLPKNKLIEIIDISEVDSYENSGYSALSKIISIKIN